MAAAAVLATLGFTDACSLSVITGDEAAEAVARANVALDPLAVRMLKRVVDALRVGPAGQQRQQLYEEWNAPSSAAPPPSSASAARPPSMAPSAAPAGGLGGEGGPSLRTVDPRVVASASHGVDTARYGPPPPAVPPPPSGAPAAVLPQSPSPSEEAAMAASCEASSAEYAAACDAASRNAMWERLAAGGGVQPAVAGTPSSMPASVDEIIRQLLQRGVVLPPARQPVEYYRGAWSALFDPPVVPPPAAPPPCTGRARARTPW